MPNPQNQGQGQGSDSSKGSPHEDWTKVEDPAERRRIQNRIAQRNYRIKKRQEAEEHARIAENQAAAGAAYTAPDLGDLSRDNPSGLPWGGFPIHAADAARNKSHLESSEGSVVSSSASQAGGSAGGTSQTGSSSMFWSDY